MESRGQKRGEERDEAKSRKGGDREGCGDLLTAGRSGLSSLGPDIFNGRGRCRRHDHWMTMCSGRALWRVACKKHKVGAPCRPFSNSAAVPRRGTASSVLPMSTFLPNPRQRLERYAQCPFLSPFPTTSCLPKSSTDSRFVRAEKEGGPDNRLPQYDSV